MSNYNNYRPVSVLVNFDSLGKVDYSMAAADEIVDILRAEGAALRDTPWGPVALDFGDWQAEYRAFRQAAGLFRPPSVAQVEITGSQRAEFLNRLATNKLDRIQPGEGCETFLADANGRILHHVFVYAGPNSLVLHTAAGLGSEPLFPSRPLPDPRGRPVPRSQFPVGGVGPRRAAIGRDRRASDRREPARRRRISREFQPSMERPSADGPSSARGWLPELSSCG